jgi:3-dehydroquinate synthase
VVSEDEFETGVRATLNLGHTFGHAIETGSGYGQYLHGEAVAIGICLAADLSKRLNWLTKQDFARIIALIKAAQLPILPPAEMSAERFIALMSVDKKNIDGKIRLILLEALGKATLPVYVEQSQLMATLKYYAG